MGVLIPYGQLRSLIRNMLREDAEDVDVSARVLAQLTPEEYAAFAQQIQARVEKVQKKQQPKQKYGGVMVPSRVLQHLSDEEMEAYADQLIAHGEDAETTRKRGRKGPNGTDFDIDVDDEEMPGETAVPVNRGTTKIMKPVKRPRVAGEYRD